MTPWTVGHPAPLSMGFPRQEHWSGWPFPPPGNLPDPGIEPGSPVLQVNSLSTEPPGVLSGNIIRKVKSRCVNTGGPNEGNHCYSPNRGSLHSVNNDFYFFK